MDRIIFCLVLVMTLAALFAVPGTCASFDFFCRAWLVEFEEDKLIHLSVFFLTTSLLLSAAGRYQTALAFVLFVFCFLSEAAQIYIPGRFLSWGDVYANLLGFLMGYTLLKSWRRMVRSRSMSGQSYSRWFGAR